MTTDEIKAVKDISGTTGFKVIEYYVNKRIQELDSVMDLDIHANEDIGTQALGKQKAVKLLKEFINDLTFVESPPKEVRRTYE